MGHEPGEALLVDEGGDAGAGALDELALQLGHGGHAVACADGRAAERSSELADAVSQLLGDRRLFGAGGEVPLVRRDLAAGADLDPDRRELGDLLAQRELRQEVVDALLRWRQPIPTMGWFSRRLPVEPQNSASPKLKMPPSLATNQ
jgi:hypothetical protein